VKMYSVPWRVCQPVGTEPDPSQHLHFSCDIGYLTLSLQLANPTARALYRIPSTLEQTIL